MLTPDGQPADKMDKIMLLSTWTRILKEESRQEIISEPVGSYISAGMGKPTYPIDLNTISFYLAYWQKIEEMAKLAMQNLDVVLEGAAIDYGDPQGDSDARILMAEAMSAWYQAEIKSEHVLFTAGGAGAIRTVFETLNERYREIPGYRVITPFPHYTLYSDNPGHRLHPIEVMKEAGYHLTAEALEASILSAIELAKSDDGYPKAVLICNPSNPLGTIIHEDDLLKIAEVLRKYPDLHIILDEAYAEMCFRDMPSLLKLAPDLKDRMIMMRSATKGLSAAGERMAMLMSFDPKMTSELLAKNISLMGHTPRSSQIVYARTMSVFNQEEREKRIDFYKGKVDYVAERLKSIGAAMPDPEYQVEATFYVLVDLSDLFGLDLPEDSKRALGKGGQVSTDEELAYYLLFKDRIMIAPLSYFGMMGDKGYMRITCSSGDSELKEMMDRLENRLLEARLSRQQVLVEKIKSRLQAIESINPSLYQEISEKIKVLSLKEKNCLAVKEDNHLLAEMLSTINVTLQKSSDEGRVQAATTLQSFFRGHLDQQKKDTIKQELESEWVQFVDAMFTEPCFMKSMLLNASDADRLKFVPWAEHLKSLGKGNHNSVNH
ncbi:pyridoxal phosphate-dependent aminotransferase [Legionella worsleiensis]|uniref:pyridoxal phosphate-dependent aminotransferase n=1 Tax=Legionella worsleiensis TaxID=45076 RepID=UPI000E058C9A|nr:pyridoxal phosphate-dependent aminotransferase [Legionella worsleiensis]STY50017.1 kynurenine--oxoglutarate transaminase [Legionella worsleiensis]